MLSLSYLYTKAIINKKKWAAGASVAVSHNLLRKDFKKKKKKHNSNNNKKHNNIPPLKKQVSSKSRYYINSHCTNISPVLHVINTYFPWANFWKCLSVDFSTD